MNANKPGWKSSEFWMAALVAGLMFLNDYFELGVKEDTIQWIAGIIITYIAGRSGLKALEKK